MLQKDEEPNYSIFPGKFIEVICQGSSAEIAELRCHAAMGFVSFCYGDHARGEIVFSERYQGDPRGSFHRVEAKSHSDIPTDVQDVFGILGPCLSKLGASTSGLDSVGVALRWYDHALDRANPQDRVIASFIGIERILRDWASETGLKSALAPLASDPIFRSHLDKYRESTDQKALDGLISNLTRPTIDECFNAYARSHALHERWYPVFKRTKALRNATAHASERYVATPTDVLEAQALLRLIIKKELYIRGTLPSEVFPGHLQNTVSWIEGEGWLMRGDVDWLDRLEVAKLNEPPW
jgi:hypothetical protein